MNKFQYIRLLLNHPDVKFIIVTTTVGCVVQLGCRRYMKNHPEMFKDINKPNANKTPKIFSPRGGEFIITGVSTAAILKAVVAFLGEHGIVSAIITGAGGLMISKINVKALSQIISESSPQNSPYPGLTSKDVANPPLNDCDASMKYLLDLLSDANIPFDEKRKMTRQIFTNYLNLNNTPGRIGFIIGCTVSILLILNGQAANVHILMRTIIEAVREGSITKPIARTIVRRLMKNNVPIDPELLDIINDD